MPRQNLNGEEKINRGVYRKGGIHAHGRPNIGANRVSWPPGKMDEKLKSENMQKRAVF